MAWSLGRVRLQAQGGAGEHVRRDGAGDSHDHAGAGGQACLDFHYDLLPAAGGRPGHTAGRRPRKLTNPRPREDGRAAPNARLKVFEGAATVACWRGGGEFNAELEAFLNEVFD